MNYIKISFRKHQGGTIRGELEDALEEMFGVTIPTMFSVGEHVWRPHTDVYETPNEVLVVVDLAGVKKEDIHLEVGRKSLRVHGKREQKALPGTTRYRLAEIAYGYFEKQVTLPVAVDEETAEAVYKDGFLEVKMLKRPPEGDRITRVTVKTEGGKDKDA
jgi:HSP20 family protein